MFHLELGNVAEWLAGLALPLAFLALLRERQDRRREQVAKVGAWCDKPVPDKGAPKPAFVAQVHVRNGSELPVVITKIGLLWEVLWPDPQATDDGGWFERGSLMGSYTDLLTPGALVPVVIAPVDNWQQAARYSPGQPESPINAEASVSVASIWSLTMRAAHGGCVRRMRAPPGRCIVGLHG